MSTIQQQLQQIFPPRKMQVRQVGSHYEAFFEGDGRSVTFGETPSEARKRLEFWSKEGKA